MIIQKINRRLTNLESMCTFCSRYVNLEKDYISKDKIKAKIEWLDKEGYFEFLSNRDILKCHNILASLLEKE